MIWIISATMYSVLPDYHQHGFSLITRTKKQNKKTTIVNYSSEITFKCLNINLSWNSGAFHVSLR